MIVTMFNFAHKLLCEIVQSRWVNYALYLDFQKLRGLSDFSQTKTSAIFFYLAFVIILLHKLIVVLTIVTVALSYADKKSAKTIGRDRGIRAKLNTILLVRQ